VDAGPPIMASWRWNASRQRRRSSVPPNSTCSTYPRYVPEGFHVHATSIHTRANLLLAYHDSDHGLEPAPSRLRLGGGLCPSTLFAHLHPRCKRATSVGHRDPISGSHHRHEKEGQILHRPTVNTKEDTFAAWQNHPDQLSVTSSIFPSTPFGYHLCDSILLIQPS
jgi:hypothetical protein